MNTRGQRFTLQRIVVALDASPHSYAALEAAVRMAARFGAELQGLYVEDINILRLAQLPFVREVGSFSTTSRRVELRTLERQFRARTLQIRRRFIALTMEQKIQQTFRVTRGKVTSEINAAASEADALIIGKAGWSRIRGRQLGSTARAAYAADKPILTMILQEGTQLKTPLLVVYDGSPTANRALDIAATLVEDEQDILDVLLLTNGPPRDATLKTQATSQLQAYDLKGRYRTLSKSNAQKIAHVVQEQGCATLVTPAKLTLLQNHALLALLEAVNMPILLVR